MEHATLYDTGDPFAATTHRWSWETDDDYAARVDEARTRSAERARSLRAAVDRVLAQGVPMPAVSRSWEAGDWLMHWTVDDAEKLRAIRRALGSPGGGPWEKDTKDGTLSLTLTDGPVVWKLSIYGSCEKVDTGATAEVERYVDVCPRCDAVMEQIPDTDDWQCSDGACDFYRPAVKRQKRTVVEPVVEWVCPDVNGEVDR